MNKKILIRIIVVVGIAAAIFFLGIAAVVLSLAVWIYLVFMVWRRKTKIINDKVEPKLAERHLKMLKAFLLAGGISLAGIVAGIIAHNALYATSETEEPVSFFVALSAIWLFVIATIGSLVMFLKLRPDFAARFKELVSLDRQR